MHFFGAIMRPHTNHHYHQCTNIIKNEKTLDTGNNIDRDFTLSYRTAMLQPLGASMRWRYRHTHTCKLNAYFKSISIWEGQKLNRKELWLPRITFARAIEAVVKMLCCTYVQQKQVNFKGRCEHNNTHQYAHVYALKTLSGVKGAAPKDEIATAMREEAPNCWPSTGNTLINPSSCPATSVHHTS